MPSTHDDMHSDATVVQEDLEHLAQVQSVVRSLVKFINGKKLYAENNPRLAQFQEELHQAISELFTVEDRLVLAVEQHELRWREQVVYSNDKRDESLAFLMYKDGVGEITIYAAAAQGELDRFIQILTEEYHAPPSANDGEDVVTRLWNSDFAHISYRVMDDYLASELAVDAEPTEEPPTDTDHAELLPSLDDKGRVIVKQTDPLESIDAYVKRVILTACNASTEQEREAYFQNMVASFFSVNDEEIAKYHEERDHERRGDGLAEFAETAFVFVLLQDNPSAVRDVSGVLERIFGYVIEDRDPRSLVRMLSLVRDFRAEYEPTESVAALCDKLEGLLTDPGLVQSFRDRLDSWDADTEHVLRYFSAAGRSVVDPLLTILHRVEGARVHREICNMLVEAAGDDIEHVLDKMDIDNPKIAQDAVYIAGRTKVRNLSPRVQELVSYPDRKIKEDMIDVLARLDALGVADVLVGAMDDMDRAIRCKAMVAAATRGFPQAADRIQELAFAKDLYDKDVEEQEAIFRALGHVANAETVAQISKFINRRHFMSFSRARENKLLAIRALENVEEPTAVEVLENLAKDANATVRARAARALAARGARVTQGKEHETETTQ